MNKELLIIGRPHSSKTTFIAQFYSKLQKKKSKAVLYKPVDNLIAIKEAREALANGDEVKTTPTEKSGEIILPIQVNDLKIELVCPDYGGEQINSIISNRIVNEKWESAIKTSNNWILFIRINNLNTSFDLSNKTVSEQQISSGNKTQELFQISDQSFFIELLQIFLSIKGHNYHKKNPKVKITIVLTCWDEMESDNSPKQVLLKHLPLLLNFIEANFEKFSVLGLSAQGFSLNSTENKEKYQIEGPENFGYLVHENGRKLNDITELIIESL